jgi:hypothetical protein
MIVTIRGNCFPEQYKINGLYNGDVMGTISGFRREANENCTRLGYYEGRSGNSLLTFREKPVGPIGCP